jgi:hypothetical protein
VNVWYGNGNRTDKCNRAVCAHTTILNTHTTFPPNSTLCIVRNPILPAVAPNAPEPKTHVVQTNVGPPSRPCASSVDPVRLIQEREQRPRHTLANKGDFVEGRCCAPRARFRMVKAFVWKCWRRSSTVPRLSSARCVKGVARCMQ